MVPDPDVFGELPEKPVFDARISLEEPRLPVEESLTSFFSSIIFCSIFLVCEGTEVSLVFGDVTFCAFACVAAAAMLAFGEGAEGAWIEGGPPPSAGARTILNETAAAPRKP